MAKLTEKEVRDILNIRTKGLDDEQKTFVDTLVAGIVDVTNKSQEGSIDSDALNKAIDLLKKSHSEELELLKKENAELVEQVKSMGTAIDKMKKHGIGSDFVTKFNEAFDTMYDSPKFQNFLNDLEKSSGSFAFKDISMTGSYSGDILISQPNDRVVSQATNKKLHIRDFATVLSGDPEYTLFPYQQIYEVSKRARYVPENGTLPQSELKIKELSAEVKRVGHHFRLSKRALKCRTYLRGYVMTCLMQGVRDAEDYAILFGDGSGDTLQGITTYDGAKAVESIITESIITGAAGSVKTLTPVANGVVVELASANDLLIEGLKITFAAAATNTGLNKTFDVIKLNDTEILLEGATVTDKAKLATDAALMTYTVNHGAFKSIESPNSMDALETAVCVMTYGQFAPSVLLLNPITINTIRTEKATDGNRLKVVEDINGNLRVGNLTAIPYTGIPAGKYFLGDFNLGAQIIDYTPLTAEWADDVETKLKNQVVLLAQAEEIVPVFCPWAFSYGSISALKTAITKPAASTGS